MRLPRTAILLALAGAIGIGIAASACDVPPSPTREKVAKSERCATCHMDDFEDAHHGRKPLACAVCHVQTRWRPLRGDAIAHTWKLDGKHLHIDCYKCHVVDKKQVDKPRIYDGTPTACVACHEKDRADADAKLEWHRDFETTCESCHTADAWKPAKHDPPPPAASSSPLPVDATPPPPPPPSASSPAASASASAPPPRPTWTPPTNWPPQPSVDIVTRPSPRRR